MPKIQGRLKSWILADIERHNMQPDLHLINNKYCSEMKGGWVTAKYSDRRATHFAFFTDSWCKTYQSNPAPIHPSLEPLLRLLVSFFSLSLARTYTVNDVKLLCWFINNHALLLRMLTSLARIHDVLWNQTSTYGIKKRKKVK